MNNQGSTDIQKHNSPPKRRTKMSWRPEWTKHAHSQNRKEKDKEIKSVRI